MKLTTEQEALLAILVAVEDYETEKYYKKSELLYKIADLGLEENGFYLADRLEGFKALEDNGLIKLVCEDWTEEEIEENVDSPVRYIEVLDEGRNYIERLSATGYKKVAMEICECAKKYLGNKNINIGSIFNIELNMVKVVKS